MGAQVFRPNVALSDDREDVVPVIQTRIKDGTSMRLNEQGRAWTRSRQVGLALLACPIAACTQIPAINDIFHWPGVSALAIWAVSPDNLRVLGRDGASLLIRWNDAVLPDTQPVISLKLVSDPDLGDPCDLDQVLAEGLDALADGPADQWVFSGADVNDLPVPAGIYRVQYTIDDQAGRTQTVESSGWIVVPIRFISPSTDVLTTQTPEVDVTIAWDTQAWEAEDFPGNFTRLDIGLSVDPNDPNDFVYINPTLLTLTGGTTSLAFDGTVYGINGAFPRKVRPNNYWLRARLHSTGGNAPFFISARSRFIIVPDPNS